MPSSETNVNQTEPTNEALPQNGAPSAGDAAPESGPAPELTALPLGEPTVVRGSRWVDYDTHELLQMISELEDERRWARLREGIWLAILVHILLISAATWIPKYVFKVPPVIDPFDAIKQRKDLTYLDSLPDALKILQPKVIVKPVTKPPVIDKQTLESMNKPTAPPPPANTPEPAAPTPAAPVPVPPVPQSQSQIEAPRPAAVPARPNFSMNSLNPNDLMREAMKGGSHSSGMGSGNQHGGLSMHPGAGSGGIEVLSDTQGVDFSNWIQRWHHETARTWDPLIPDEVNAPILKSGTVAIRFKVLPNGRLMEGGMVLEGRSGDVALDRAAWGALTGSNYPPLPKEFHGPYLELRAYFLYNMEPQR